VPVGGIIEYTVTLTSAHGVQVDLRCIGKVVRLERFSSEAADSSYLIAATLDRYQFVRGQSAPIAEQAAGHVV